jgi:hypothetical protein
MAYWWSPKWFRFMGPFMILWCTIAGIVGGFVKHHPTGQIIV